MVIVAIQNHVGDIAELEERYRRSNAILRDRGPAEGALVHLSFQTGSGLCLLNVWQTIRDLQHAAVRRDFRAALEGVGMPYVEPVVHRLVRLSVHAT